MQEIDLTRLDLNLLVTFEVLMSEGSVTRTATRLGRTQSAVSHALSRLRDQLGDPLLVKTGSGMAPSPFAEDLIKEVRPILRNIQRVVAPPEPFVSTRLRIDRRALPPGPRGAALQSLRYMRDPYGYTERMRARYGDPFSMPSLNGFLVIACSPEGVREILAGSDKDFGTGFAADALVPIVGAGSLLMLSGEAHRRERKTLLRAVCRCFYSKRATLLPAHRASRPSSSTAGFAIWRISSSAWFTNQ